MELIIQRLNLLEELPNEEAQYLLSQSRTVNFKKDEYFYVSGEENSKIWFINEGMAKSIYSKEDGKTFVKNFIQKGSFVAPFLEMTKGIPTRDAIVARTDVKALEFDFDILERLQKRHVVWIKLYMEIMRNYYFLKEQREYELLMLDAKERYLSFVKGHKEMLKHINQYEIASYLGITKTSLSRILKSLNNGG